MTKISGKLESLSIADTYLCSRQLFYDVAVRYIKVSLYNLAKEKKNKRGLFEVMDFTFFPLDFSDGENLAA